MEGDKKKGSDEDGNKLMKELQLNHAMATFGVFVHSSLILDLSKECNVLDSDTCFQVSQKLQSHFEEDFKEYGSKQKLYLFSLPSILEKIPSRKKKVSRKCDQVILHSAQTLWMRIKEIVQSNVPCFYHILALSFTGSPNSTASLEEFNLNVPKHIESIKRSDAAALFRRTKCVLLVDLPLRMDMLSLIPAEVNSRAVEDAAPFSFVLTDSDQKLICNHLLCEIKDPYDREDLGEFDDSFLESRSRLVADVLCSHFLMHPRRFVQLGYEPQADSERIIEAAVAIVMTALENVLEGDHYLDALYNFATSFVFDQRFNAPGFVLHFFQKLWQCYDYPKPQCLDIETALAWCLLPYSCEHLDEPYGFDAGADYLCNVLVQHLRDTFLPCFSALDTAGEPVDGHLGDDDQGVLFLYSSFLVQFHPPRLHHPLTAYLFKDLTLPLPRWIVHQCLLVPILRNPILSDRGCLFALAESLLDEREDPPRFFLAAMADAGLLIGLLEFYTHLVENRRRLDERQKSAEIYLNSIFHALKASIVLPFCMAIGKIDRANYRHLDFDFQEFEKRPLPHKLQFGLTLAYNWGLADKQNAFLNVRANFITAVIETCAAKFTQDSDEMAEYLATATLVLREVYLGSAEYFDEASSQATFKIALDQLPKVNHSVVMAAHYYIKGDETSRTGDYVRAQKLFERALANLPRFTEKQKQDLLLFSKREPECNLVTLYEVARRLCAMASSVLELRPDSNDQVGFLLNLTLKRFLMRLSGPATLTVFLFMLHYFVNDDLDEADAYSLLASPCNTWLVFFLQTLDLSSPNRFGLHVQELNSWLENFGLLTSSSLNKALHEKLIDVLQRCVEAGYTLDQEGFLPPDTYVDDLMKFEWRARIFVGFIDEEEKLQILLKKLHDVSLGAHPRRETYQAYSQSGYSRSQTSRFQSSRYENRGERRLPGSKVPNSDWEPASIRKSAHGGDFHSGFESRAEKPLPSTLDSSSEWEVASSRRSAPEGDFDFDFNSPFEPSTLLTSGLERVSEASSPSSPYVGFTDDPPVHESFMKFPDASFMQFDNESLLFSSAHATFGDFAAEPPSPPPPPVSPPPPPSPLPPRWSEGDELV